MCSTIKNGWGKGVLRPRNDTRKCRVTQEFDRDPRHFRVVVSRHSALFLCGLGKRSIMLIYLDTMIVQYCAGYEDFIFGDDRKNPANEPKLAGELVSLRQLVELEQFGDWTFAAPSHLMNELLAGKPNSKQRRGYRILLEVWQDSAWSEFCETSEDKILSICESLRPLKLKGAADQRHLAEAIALNASWFLTNDGNVIRRTRTKGQKLGRVYQVRVARPSECIEEISVGLFLR